MSVFPHSYAACIFPLVVTPAEVTYVALEWIDWGNGDHRKTQKSESIELFTSSLPDLENQYSLV